MMENSSGLLRIANEADRATVATILFKNGYTVTLKRIKTGSRKAEMYVEYGRPGETTATTAAYDDPHSVEKDYSGAPTAAERFKLAEKFKREEEEKAKRSATAQEEQTDETQVDSVW